MVVESFSFEEDELLSAASERYLAAVLDGLDATAAQRASALPVFRKQAAFWRDRLCSEPPVTRVTLLGAPLECSVVLEEGAPEVRWAVELLGDEPTSSAYRTASFAYLAQLADEGVPLAGELRRKLQPIEHFHMLHGVVCSPDGTIGHKLYVHSWHLAAPRLFPWLEILRLIGAGAFADRLQAFCGPSDYLTLLCIDLTDDAPRVKAYINVRPSRGGEILKRLGAEEGFPSVEPVARFREVVKQGAEQIGDVEVFSLVSRLNDAEGRFEQLTFSLHTLAHSVAPYVEQVPVLGSDAFYVEGLTRFATGAGLSTARIVQVLDRVLPEPLADSHYFFTYFSYQERKLGAPRVTAYFAPPFFLPELAGFLSSTQNRLSP
jgi:hypothetical protein